MDAALGLAGVITVALAVGHETLGLVWVLPNLTQQRLRDTPFGPPSMTVAMICATWHLITVFAAGLGTILIILAADVDADPRTVLLRVVAVMWLVAAATAVSVAARRVRRVRDLLRLPVPVFFVLVAILCWVAST